MVSWNSLFKNTYKINILSVFHTSCTQVDSCQISCSFHYNPLSSLYKKTLEAEFYFTVVNIYTSIYGITLVETVIVIAAILSVVVYWTFTICQALYQALHVFSHLTFLIYNSDYEKKWDKQFFKGFTNKSRRTGLKNSVPKIVKQILKFIWKFKGHRIANLEKRKMGGFLLPYFKLQQSYSKQDNMILE